MMTGQVREGFPRLIVQVTGESTQDEIEFIVDTGFEGRLTLPAGWIAMLGAHYTGERRFAMADGSVGARPTFRVNVRWNEEERTVTAVGLDGNPLLGVEMLNGCVLNIDMTEGGEIVIEPD